MSALILIVFHHPYLDIGGVERRFLNVMKRWETLRIEFRIIESQQALHPYSRRIPTLLKKDTPSTYIIRGLIFGLLSIVLSLKDRGFDVILAYNNDIFSVASAFIISRISHRPCVVLIHHYDVIDGRKLVESFVETYNLLRRIGYGGPFHSILKALSTKLAMTIAGKCQATICVSKAFAKLFPNSYLSSNAVKHSLMNMAVLIKKEYEACFVGRLDVRKGIMELVDVWKRVVDIFPDAKLAIVGHANERTLIDLTRIIRSYSLDKNIVCLGRLSDKEMYDTIMKSRLFITLSTSEGWGIAIAEALACGVPVVCYDIITLYEQWNMCPYVIFAHLHDMEDATKKIVNFLSSREPDFHEIKKCVQNLRWEDVALRDLEILRKITEENGANST